MDVKRSCELKNITFIGHRFCFYLEYLYIIKVRFPYFVVDFTMHVCFKYFFSHPVPYILRYYNIIYYVRV